MKRLSIIAIFMACVIGYPSQAQNNPSALSFGGAVLNNDFMMAGDFAALSQVRTFGTARSMAMGGAFTSLGADMSSMSLNPAGLGMYRRNEISFTPMLSLSHGSTQGTQDWQGNNKTRFSFANIGAALNVYESSSNALTSLTLGFGMNRIADFNSRYSFSSDSRYDPSTPDRLMPTIADVFGQQLGQAGIFPNSEGGLGYDYNPAFWPAILGYNAFMVSAVNGEWVPDAIGRNASVLHSMDVLNAGSINEFTLSMGANINNIFYIGASLGIQSVHKSTEVIYQEEYGYFNTQGGVAVDRDGNTLPQQLDYMNLWQQKVLDGSGVNFKLGMIVRPVAGLRLGVAFHTPTFYSLDLSYRGNIESVLLSNTSDDSSFNTDNSPTQHDESGNAWEFVSPSRLMFGASYTFGNFAIVSVDYERDWYNGIRVKNTPNGADLSANDYKAEFKSNFCATNSLRAGIEVRPLPMLALRVGGGYTSSMLKDESLYFNTPLATESYFVSAGVGLNISRNVVLDLAYQNHTDKQTKYELFFSRDVDTGEFMTNSGLYDTQIKRHFITMTLGFRF